MRQNWIAYLEKIVHPVLSAAAADRLKIEMPVYKGRNESQYLEAIGRIICGIGPWLNLDLHVDSKEEKIQRKYKELSIKAISNIVNSKSCDYFDFGLNGQALVDAAYLCQGVLRAPKLWNSLNKEVQENFIIEIKKTRQVNPSKNNWLLFVSMVETFLLEYSEVCNMKKLRYGVKQFITNYYLDDGFYGDGKRLSIDHYNSFVIQPMLTDILSCMNKHDLKKSHHYQKKHSPRYKRYLEIQERMISPEGAYPLFGRTLICRFGVFHALAQGAFLQLLPNSLYTAQVRCGLNAVLKRHMDSIENFDSKGFMVIGFNGKQLQMAEDYVSSGSPYHCCTIFLPLGLKEENQFWSDDDCKWTSLKAFSGLEFNVDKPFHEVNETMERLLPFKYKLQSGWLKLKSLYKK